MPNLKDPDIRISGELERGDGCVESLSKQKLVGFLAHMNQIQQWFNIAVSETKLSIYYVAKIKHI